MAVDLNRVDLNLLVALDALLAERHVTRAAARLSVGQSAMSATLRRLRKLFQDPLLVRQGRELVPTPFAEGLALSVRRALQQLSELLEPASQNFDPQRDARTFSIMASDYVTLVLLHPMLVRLQRDFPSIRLHLQPIGVDYEQPLANNEIDLLIAPLQAFPQHVRYRHQRLFQDRLVCAVAATNTEVGEGISAEQFSALPYLQSHVAGQPSIAERQLDALGVPRNVELTTSMTLAPFLIRGTHLMTLIHEHLGRRVAREVELRLIDPPFPLLPVEELMVWTDLRDVDPGHRWLRDRLAELAAELLTPAPPHEEGGAGAVQG